MNPKSTAIALTAALLIIVNPAISSETSDQNSPMNFEGRYLVSVSDADMVASAYVNGDLGPQESEDSLSVIQLGGEPREWAAAEVPAPNSVAGPPASVDLSPDGRFAFVIETWTQRPTPYAKASFADLKFGNRLSVFDLTDPETPQLVHETTVPLRPDAIRVNHDGTLVALAFHGAGGGKDAPIGLYPFDGSELGDPVFTTLQDWPSNGRMIDLDWHPTQNTLAIIDEVNSTLYFADVDTNLGVTVRGNVVGIEKAPFRVEFTPDGRHVVVNAVYWGKDIAGYWIEAPRGSVLTVRMNADIHDNTPRHAMVSTIKTGVSPEGLAVSPDGKWVATTNLERSYLPYDDPRITWFSTITLAKLDPETGQLVKVGDFSYDGILPEAAVFDNSSTYLAVANYDHFDDRKLGGSVDFWRIAHDPLEDSTTYLVKTEHSVPVTRGVHSMVIAR